MLRKVSLFAAAVAALAVVAGPVAAKGGKSADSNAPNAKACQKGGWEALAPSTSPTVAFTSETECTSYAAKKGNTIVALQASSGDPVLAACNEMGGTLTYPAENLGDPVVHIRCLMTEGAETTHAAVHDFMYAPGVAAACAAMEAPPGFYSGSWNPVAFSTGNGYTEPIVWHWVGAQCESHME